MPKCKNDSTRKYKGDEPSPKGLGFCAHAEKEGLTKKGKDGNYWEVKTTKNGTKRWVKATKEVKERSTKKEKDKNMLIVKEGIKGWVKATKEEEKKALNVYFPKLLPTEKKWLNENFKINLLKNKLEDIDVLFNIEKIQEEFLILSGEYIGTKTEEKLAKIGKNGNFIYLLFFINAGDSIGLLPDSIGYDFALNFALNKEKSKEVNKVFKEVYGKNFKWGSGKYKEEIFIRNPDKKINKYFKL